MMRVRLLGTGSADGWPNAFCSCASCRSAHASGRLRGPTSALVDDRILLDCGPETARDSLRYGGGLTGVGHVLVTHDHPDHSSPMALLARDWAGRDEPLVVVGPPAVGRSWSRWVGPDSPVRFVDVQPGDVLDADGYAVRVLAAAHLGSGDDGLAEAVLYDLTAPTGERLLYATDTGPLPDETRSATAGAAFDLVLLEATYGDRLGPGAPAGTDHLDLSAFAAELAGLRRSRAVVDATDVVAVHLSHHSPPDLEQRLAGWGARVLEDGDLVVVGRSAHQRPKRPRNQIPPRRGRTLVLGGARSGKSLAAERLLVAEPAVTYVATGPVPDGSDAEWAQRVERHRHDRPGHWTTVETDDLVGSLRAASTPVMVDCLGTWLTGLLDRVGAWDDRAGWRDDHDDEVDRLLEVWRGLDVPAVAVSNEVGSGVVPATASGRLFQDLLGRLNARVSLASERVLLVVAGRTLDLSPPSPPTSLEEPTR